MVGSRLYGDRDWNSESSKGAQRTGEGWLPQTVNNLTNDWDQLNPHTTDGRIPIDINDVGQLLKQVVTGRKNGLVLGNPDAGHCAATLTLISTALRYHVDVWAYLKAAIDQLQAAPSDYQFLRPDVWKLANPQFVRTYRTEESRDAATRTGLTRAHRRLANAKKQNAR
jgi:hypothetical protein